MATPFKDAEVAVWDWLAADTTYQALQLHEFRGHDGMVLPFDVARGPVAAADLPAIGCLLTLVSTQRRGQQYEHRMRTTWQIVYRAEGHPTARDEIETALVIVQQRLNSGEALRDKWGAPSAIAAGELIPDGLKPWTAEERGEGESATVMFWEARFHFEIILHRMIG